MALPPRTASRCAAGDVQRAREAGFDHHLTKPADPGVLSRMISPA
ncbi:MAG TPA: hypothetical protein VFB93_06655 [Burkholderiales bacterium]|nr:hypothetical protein [Burkholderiales bacterium]